MTFTKKLQELYDKFSSPIIRFFKPIIGRINDFIIFLKPILPNVIIVALGGIALGSTQGKDVVANIGYSPPSIRWWFLGAIFLTGLCAWFWTRMITNNKSVLENINRKSNISHGIFFKHVAESKPKSFDAPEESKFYQLYFPLFLGACPFIFANFALYNLRDNGGEVLLSTQLTLIVLTAIFLGLAIFEFNLSKRKTSLTHSKKSGIYASRVAFSMAVLTTTLSIIFAFLFLWSKYIIPQSIGPGGLAFGAFAMLIPVFSILVIASHYSRLPFITIIFTCYLVSDFKLNGWDKTHEVRRFDESSTVSQKLEIDEAFEIWLDLQEKNLSPCEDEVQIKSNTSKTTYCAPILFISVTGGASRAAYFSQSILSFLETKSKFRLHENIFSISAISGGALGAVSYSGSLDLRSKNLTYYQSEYSNNEFAKRLAGFNGSDYLSPTLTGLLYLDPIDDLTFRAAHLLGYKDRATGLEKAFEAGWADTYGITPLSHKGTDKILREKLRNENKDIPFMFSDPLMSLFPISEIKATNWRPALMLIGTHQETGKRISTGHINPPDNVDMLDFHTLFGGDIRASTAVMNSARFPIISPPGAIVENENFKGHILDGGYFEGDGIETSLDIFEDVMSAFKKLQTNKEKHFSDDILYEDIRLKPIFIEINSADILPALDKERCLSIDCNVETRYPSSEPQKKFLNEVSGPLQGLLSTRGGRGVMGAKRVSERIAKFTETERLNISPQYIQFDLCLSPNDKKSTPTAVSWSLSEISKANIDTILFDAPLNPPAFLDEAHELQIMVKRSGPEKSCVRENQVAAKNVLEIITQ